MRGDAGGPWLAWAAGAWQLFGVHEGSRGPAAVEGRNDVVTGSWATGLLGPVDGYTSALAWVRSTAGLPVVAAGRLVRDPTSGDAWLVDESGYRRWIPDGATFECLEANGHSVINLAGINIDTIPDRVGVHATCGGGDVLLFDHAGEGQDIEALTAALTDAGYDVTASANLPADLGAFDQVWALTESDGLRSDVLDSLAGHVRSGGSLYINSEHGGCCPEANESVQQLINEVVVGGGVELPWGCAEPCVSGATNPFNPTAIGGIATRPNANVSLQTAASGRYLGVHGDNVLMRSSSGEVTGAVWAEASIVGGSGRLVVVADSNWTDLALLEAFGNQSALENIAAFLAGWRQVSSLDRLIR